jgi:protein TonB
MSEQEEKKNQWVAILTSVGFHAAILLLFLFVMGWTPPDPPLSELGSGVELNFGLDQEGSGDVQPEISEGVNEKKPDAKSEEEQKKETPDVVKDEVKPNESKQEDEKLTSQDDESPVVVKDSKKEIKRPDPVTVKTPEIKPKAKDKPVKDEGASFKYPSGSSQGDDKNKAGDKGSKEGSLDPNGQYTGRPGTGGNGGGGGNGFALNMSGWNWDAQPQAPKLPDNENGKIVFEITVDSDGEIINIETLQRGLSPEAERICKEEIQKRSMVRTSSSAAPDRSKGRITFVLHTQ